MVRCLQSSQLGRFLGRLQLQSVVLVGPRTRLLLDGTRGSLLKPLVFGGDQRQLLDHARNLPLVLVAKLCNANGCCASTHTGTGTGTGAGTGGGRGSGSGGNGLAPW
jgi:hypothetical protein